jgi:hypothetical protein
MCGGIRDCITGVFSVAGWTIAADFKFKDKVLVAEMVVHLLEVEKGQHRRSMGERVIMDAGISSTREKCSSRSFLHWVKSSTDGVTGERASQRQSTMIEN